jgi:hypothetical protein
MYGLMKAHLCSRHASEAQQRRLHYCGACKTMGRLYGQPTRLLLNHDAVFLAELLTGLSPHSQPVAEWNPAYQSYNCFALPADVEQMPLPLQVAAAVTLLMSQFKVADQVADGRGGKWKAVGRILSPAFVRAADQLEGWGFPLAEYRQWEARQELLEAEAQREVGARPVQVTLASVAEPTAQVTAGVFAHSASVVGADAETQQLMHELGFAFGTLVYLLDAYEDFATDGQRGEFNALRVAYQLSEPEMPEEVREVVLEQLRLQGERVEVALRRLPLPSEQIARFAARLQRNLAQRLGGQATASHSGNLSRVGGLLRHGLRMVAAPLTPALAGSGGAAGLSGNLHHSMAMRRSRNANEPLRAGDPNTPDNSINSKPGCCDVCCGPMMACTDCCDVCSCACNIVECISC